MPRVVRKRRISASPSVLWSVISDPYHLPRWWPRTRRVENVAGSKPDGRTWTQVLETREGRGIRADYRSVAASENEHYVYEQMLEGTPFEGILRSSQTVISLAPQNGETQVTLASVQRLKGLSRFGGLLMRRATGRMLSDALDGLEQATTGGEQAEAPS